MKNGFCHTGVIKERKASATCFFDLAWLVFVLLTIHNACADWRISGTVSREAYGLSGGGSAVKGAETWSFQLSLNGSNWLIHTEPIHSTFPNVALPSSNSGNRIEPGPGFQYIETGRQSNLTYMLSRFRDSKTQTANVAEGAVITAPVPLFNHNLHSLLWLGFASGRTLIETKTNRFYTAFAFPGSNLRAARRGQTQPAFWTLQEGSIPYPLTFVALDEGFKALWPTHTAEDSGIPPIKVERDSTLDRPYTNLMYTATAFTNVDGNVWPVAGELECFASLKAASSGGLFLLQKLSFSVTDVTIAKRESYVPKLPGATFVSDSRYDIGSKPLKGIFYMATNAWKTEDELNKTHEYARAARIQEKAKQTLARHPALADFPKKSAAPRMTILLILGATFCIPLTVFLRKSSKH